MKSLPSTYLWDLNDIAGLQIDNVPIRSSGNATLVERHDVLCERSRFIGENVLDLTQLLVQRRRSGLRKSFRLLIKHFLVPIDLEWLSKADDLENGCADKTTVMQRKLSPKQTSTDT